jgi:hypothetical protein
MFQDRGNGSRGCAFLFLVRAPGDCFIVPVGLPAGERWCRTEHGLLKKKSAERAASGYIIVERLYVNAFFS